MRLAVVLLQRAPAVMAEPERLVSWIGRGRSSRNRNAHLAVPALLESGRADLVQMALQVLVEQPAGLAGRSGQVAGFLEDPALAALAAEALAGAPGTEALVPRMIAAWRVPELQDRAGFLRALARTQDERVVPVLLEALGDRDDLVAETAANALERIRRVREQREMWEAWQAAGAGSSPVAALILKTRSASKEVRLAAIASLGTLGDPQALPVLVELLEADDAEVAAAARAALAKING